LYKYVYTNIGVIIMVTRNSTNKIEFNTQEWGAPVSYFTIDTGASLDNRN